MKPRSSTWSAARAADLDAGRARIAHPGGRPRSPGSIFPRWGTLALVSLALLASPPVPADGAGPPPSQEAGPAHPRPVPLIEAVRSGDLARVQRLLNDNADVNVARLNGLTALHMAAQRGDEDIARVLIEAGADVNAVLMGSRRTPLYLAAEHGHADLVRLLLSRGASISQSAVAIAVVNGHRRVVDLLLRHGANVDRRDAHGDSYLHLAVLGGRAAMVNLLLSHGADVNARNADGLTPLSLAAGNRAVAAALRGGGARWAPPPGWKTLASTADMAADRSDYKTAAAKYELALADLGPSARALPWRLTLLHKLTHAYLQTDQLDKARRAGLRFVKEYRRDAGVSPLTLARVSTLLGRVYVAQGELHQAQKRYRAAVDIYEKQSPPDTDSLADAYLRLANALMRQQQYAGAQEVFEKARRSLQHDPRADPLILAVTEQSLAHTLRFEGELDRAEALYEHSNALLAKASGADPGLSANGTYGLADIARRRGQWEKAAALYKEAIAAFEKHNDLSPAALKAVKREYRSVRRRLSRPAPQK